VASDATIESIDVDPEADDPCGAGYPYLADATELFPDGIDVVGTPTADMRASTDAADVDVFVAFYDYLEGAGADTSVIFAYGGARARFRGPNASPVAALAAEVLPLLHDALVLSKAKAATVILDDVSPSMVVVRCPQNAIR